MISTLVRALRALATRPFTDSRSPSPYADPYALQTTHLNGGRVF